jgi:phenylpyruvate tautomerase PptA (4-oxalocrotonate tautomerase family)
MPIITVQQFTGRSEAQKNELARQFTAAVRAVYGPTAQPVQVVFQEVGMESWFSEGTPVYGLPRNVGG